MSNGKNDQAFARLFKLQATVGKLVLDGKRTPDEVSDSLQTLIEKKDGVVAPHVFEVTSNGLSGESWIAHLKTARYSVGDYTMQILRDKKFVATNGVTYRFAIIKGEEFEDGERVTENIRAEATRRGYLTPSAEHAPLLRELISDEEIEAMGLYWLVVMHEPIKDADDRPYLLGLYRGGDGRWLSASWGGPGYRWDHGHGFVFLAPQE